MRALVIAVLVLGCRFGGPTAPPQSGAAPADAAADAGPEHVIDAPLDVMAALDGPPAAPPDLATSDGCAAPTPAAVCDPVCNTGCPALSRCDVGEGTRTGACVGIWIGGEGSACFKGSTTDACAPRLTCVSGTCRRLCYRDSDCAPGGCCTGPLPSGFMTCLPCVRP